MATVEDQQGRTYDAVQLAAPATVNGLPVAAGWWVVTDRFGHQSVCSPESFASMFQNPSGTQITVPVPAVPADQMIWQTLYAGDPGGLAVPAGGSATLTFPEAQGLRQAIVDTFCLSATAVAVTAGRKWSAGGYPINLASGNLAATNATFSADLGEGTASGRLLGAPVLFVTLSNSGASQALIFVQVVGR